MCLYLLVGQQFKLKSCFRCILMQINKKIVPTNVLAYEATEKVSPLKFAKHLNYYGNVNLTLCYSVISYVSFKIHRETEEPARS